MLNRDILLAIADGKYNLLLGAGFSIKAKNGFGEGLPGGMRLIEILKKEFDMEDVDYSLQALHETLVALGRKNRKGQNAEEFLKTFFSNCEPEWHGIAAAFNWSRIWTLNIDDLLERAISRDYNDLQARSYIWTDQYHDKVKNKLDIIHLHGYVKAETTNFVFSISQYREAVALKQTWHSVFGDLLPNDPFIIIGSSLQNEFDFQDAIGKLQERKDTLHPTILVTMGLDKYQKEVLENKGIIILDTTAKNFFESIYDEYKVIKSENNAPELASYSFASQFAALDKRVRLARYHDYYSGDEPSINDILDDLDCAFENTVKSYEILQKLMLDDEITRPIVGRISGLPGTGKTTALLRIGMVMNRSGFNSFYYRNLEDMDIDSILTYVKGKKLVLLFDNAGVFMPQIVSLVERLYEKKIKIAILYSDREKFSKLINERLRRRSFSEDILAEYNLVSNNDALKLYNMLDSKGRLGRLAGIRDENIRYKEFTRKKQLVNIMYALNHENGHRERMMSEFVNINNPKIKLVYIIACAMNSEGFKLTLPWISAFLKISQNDIIEGLENSEVTMIRVNKDRGQYYIGVKNRSFSQDFMRFHSKEVDSSGDYIELKYHVILHFLKWLSTHVDQKFYDNNSKYYQVTVRFLSYSLLRNWLSNSYVSEIYKELKTWWNNNARFWEQYALFHADVNEYPVAVSYANNALRRRSDGFTNNTVGKIMMERAYKNLSPGTPTSLESLIKGIEHLHISYEQDSVSKYQFPTFFSNAFKYITANSGKIPEGLSDEMDAWFALSRNHFNNGDEKFESQINRYRNEWLRAQFPETRTAPKKIRKGRGLRRS